MDFRELFLWINLLTLSLDELELHVFPTPRTAMVYIVKHI